MIAVSTACLFLQSLCARWIRQDLLKWFNVDRCLQVWVIVCMDNVGDADEVLTFDLPILKKMGAQVYSKCKSIRPVTCWVEDLKKLVAD